MGPDRRDRPGENLIGLIRAKTGDVVANVHRIDEEASGIVLYAKTKTALDFVSGQFQSKTVTKLHQALVIGLPASAEYTIDLVLKEDEAKPGTMCIVKKYGLASETRCVVREEYPRSPGPGFALVDCFPLTGRMHQIRVHLAATGTPILNDALYADDTRLMLSDLKRGYKGRADEKPLIARLALHAAALTFVHPLTREKMTIAAPLPKDFSVALKYLEKYAARKPRS